MNDPKTLQIIAEKACQFDQAHFDDDVPVAVESLLANHERLPADRKLITRLRPRYAVALGFFEGYTKATEDLASKSTSQTNIGIVIKPPPPPAAPPAPNELRMEIDDELAQAAAEYANDEEGFPTTARDIDEVRDAMKAGKGWHAVVRSFVHGAQWQLSRIENAHAGDDPTMHFPPAFDRAPMPSDREIVDLICRTVYADRNIADGEFLNSVVKMLDNDPDGLCRTIGLYSGMRAEACAIKFALLHFRDRLVGPANKVQNAERTQYETTIRQKNERIAELEAQLKDEIENLNETARENVKLANDASELRASVFGYFQNEHRSNPSSLAARNHLRSLVGLPSIRSTTPVVAVSKPESEAGNAIVFHDDAECDYWKEMSYVLAAKKDTTSRSVATAADEMVEERRKRLSVHVASETGTRPAIIGVPTANEITDELLLEAARFANKENDDPEHNSDIVSAREAIALSATDAWSVFVRGYINGAQRSSREL